MPRETKTQADFLYLSKQNLMRCNAYDTLPADRCRALLTTRTYMIRKIHILFILITLFSCSNSNYNRFDLKGYSTSDSLTNDFEQIDKYIDKPFGRAIYIADPRFEVSTINNIIYNIRFSPLTDKEFKLISKKIMKILNHEPTHNKGVTQSGIKIIGDELFWFDSISGDKFSIGIDYRKDSAYSLWIYNHKVMDSLSLIYVPDYDTVDIEYELFEIADTVSQQNYYDKDETEIQMLIQEILKWSDSKESFDLLPLMADNNDLITGFDLRQLDSNLIKLENTGFFSKEFINNYDQIIRTLDKKLRNKEFKYNEWYIGELPIFRFANGASPWCMCQDTPSNDLSEIEINNINDSSADLEWIWNPGSDWVDFKIRVVREDNKWKVSYLQGFDYNEAIKGDGE